MSETSVTLHSQRGLLPAVLEVVSVLIVRLLAQFLQLLDQPLNSFLRLLALCHLASQLLLREASRLSECLAESLLGTEVVDAALVVFLELLVGLAHQLLHVAVDFLHLGVSLLLGLHDHVVDFLHLVLVPVDLLVRVVPAGLEELAGS